MSLNGHQDSGEPPLVVFLPGIGEEEAESWEPFRDVVRSIPLSYFDWTELVKPETTFADLVSHLKAQIRDRMPTGPLRLVGYSIGGPLAYACAMALQKEGQAPQYLIVLDGRASYGPPSTTLRDRWDQFTTFQVRAGLASVLAKILTRKPALPLLRRLAPLRHVNLPFNFGAYLHNKLKMQLMVRMFSSWWHEVAQPNSELTVPVFVFRSEEHESWEPEDLGWGNYCSNVSVIRVTGKHETMLDPQNFGPLCTELAKLLKNRSIGSAAPTSSSRVSLATSPKG